MLVIWFSSSASSGPVAVPRPDSDRLMTVAPASRQASSASRYAIDAAPAAPVRKHAHRDDPRLRPDPHRAVAVEAARDDPRDVGPVLGDPAAADVVQRPAVDAVARLDVGRGVGGEVDAGVDHAHPARDGRRAGVGQELGVGVDRLRRQVLGVRGGSGDGGQGSRKGGGAQRSQQAGGEGDSHGSVRWVVIGRLVDSDSGTRREAGAAGSQRNWRDASAPHGDLHLVGHAGQEREPGLLAHAGAEHVGRAATGAREAVALREAAGAQPRRAERHPA